MDEQQVAAEEARKKAEELEMQKQANEIVKRSQDARQRAETCMNAVISALNQYKCQLKFVEIKGNGQLEQARWECTPQN